jgi:shikimate dehydrogenase
MAGFLPALVGSLSEGAAGNPTVAMIEAGFRHHGIDARYVNTEVAASDLADAVRGARAMGWVGFNLSIPHKVAVIDHLDGLGRSAAAIGAVNCVVRRDGRYLGENTDGKGFVAALRGTADPAGTRVMIVGAGGAARAIAVELVLAGAASLMIVNRSAERAVGLLDDLRTRLGFEAALLPLGDAPIAVPAGTSVLVNATSVGLYAPDASIAVDWDTVAPGTVVADVVFNPVDTALLQAARRHGCTAVDGLGMLVEQGALAIAFWTGVDPDRAVLRAALLEATQVDDRA